MESEKPLMFLGPEAATAARGQVLEMARGAVIRAADSMVFLIVVGYMYCFLFVFCEGAGDAMMAW